MSAIHQMSIAELQDATERGDLSFREVTTAFLDHFEKVDPLVKAFLSLDRETVLEEADKLDRRKKDGLLQPGPLTGIPVAVKDVIVTENVRTSCGSRILENYRPPYDATVVRRLKEAGAIVFGKTNCDEFAMGSSTENSAYSPTRNPWDLDRVPGGSSGGSAAAVAARLVPASLGTDTGGSIRQPAAFCGVVGLKPTYGRVSRYGLVAFASSLDQIGPFANNVSDLARVLQVISGEDPRDSTSSPRPVPDYLQSPSGDLRGMRVGLIKEWISSGLDPFIRDAVLSALGKLEDLGCSVEEVSLPNSKYAIATYYIIAPAEASSNLARYDGVRYGFRSARHENLLEMYRATRSQGFGEEVKRRIMLGTYVLSAGYYDAYYLKASQVRRLILQDYQRAFQSVDVLVGPTTPTTAFRLGEKVSDPLEMYLSDVYTVTANLTGIPGLSLPCSVSPEGLPVGIQLLAPHFEEERLLRAGATLERELSLESRPPMLR